MRIILGIPVLETMGFAGPDFSVSPKFPPLRLIFLREIYYDKTDIKADGLAALLSGCPDGMQRKN